MAYIAKPFRAPVRRVGLVLAILLVLTAGEAANSWSQTAAQPREIVTVAEFAENYNRQADYLDFGGRAYLDEDGQWQEKPEDGSQIISLEDLIGMRTPGTMPRRSTTRWRTAMSQRSPCPEPSKIPQLCGWKHLTAMCPKS